MSVFKCKMCGGSLEITEGQSVCTCEYCGTEQTLPKLDSDRKTNLYDRANHFRRNNDFDKAMSIYDQILNEDNTDAEAYWSLVLCRYGIEYVEDSATHKRIPTVNRAQYTSIYADEDYKAALKNANDAQKIVYEQEAKTIDEIQKGILAISEKEDPFDVFICYKETDDTGRRTQDSVLANDLYHQLTQEGFKVFFSRITLEDKLGQEYEPYIFAALNSAKAMVVLGTKPEYFNAVWVKNEWSRYLALIRSGAKKILIPAYKDMDPYDLPEDFSHLQAQDMAKLGFMQDLIRGIKKIIGTDQTKIVSESVAVQQGAGIGNNNALIKRGNMALEDCEWQKADGFFEEVLNQDAECAEAYLGKWLAKIEQSDLSQLTEYYFHKYDKAGNEVLEACEVAEEHIQSMINQYYLEGFLGKEEIKKLYVYDRTYNSALGSLKNQKEKTISEINDEKLYIRAKQYATVDVANMIDGAFSGLVQLFDDNISACQKSEDDNIRNIKKAYDDHINQADIKVQELYNSAVEKREGTYQSRIEAFNSCKSILDYETAKRNFQDMNGYKDSISYINKCDEKLQELNEKKNIENERQRIAREKEAKKKTQKKYIMIGSIVAACIVIGIVTIVSSNHKKQTKYNQALQLVNDGKYTEAENLFQELGTYKDAASQKENASDLLAKQKYEEGVKLFDAGKYLEAASYFNGGKGTDIEKYKEYCSIYAKLSNALPKDTTLNSLVTEIRKLEDFKNVDALYNMIPMYARIKEYQLNWWYDSEGGEWFYFHITDDFKVHFFKHVDRVKKDEDYIDIKWDPIESTWTYITVPLEKKNGKMIFGFHECKKENVAPSDADEK